MRFSMSSEINGTSAHGQQICCQTMLLYDDLLSAFADSLHRRHLLMIFIIRIC